MSLLMDALRTAEDAQASHLGHTTPASALALDPLDTPSTPASIAPRPLSGWRNAVASDPASVPTTPSPGDAAEAAPADVHSGERLEPAAVRKVFAVKQTPRSHRALWWSLGLGGLATLAVGGYFWWQLQTIASGALTSAAAAPAASAPSTMPTTPPPMPILWAAEAPSPTVGPTRPAPAAQSSAPAARPPRARRETAPQAQAAGVFRLGKQRATQNQALDLAYEAWQAGRLDEAHRGYAQVLDSDARNADALLGLAAIALRQGQLERAHDLYLRVIESDPSDATAQAALINLRNQGDAGPPESRLKTLLASQPDSSAVPFALGNLYARQGRWSDAQQAYFQAYALDPDNADYIFNVAVSLDHLRQSRLAAQYYQMALTAADRGRGAFDRTAAGKRILELQP